MRALGHTLLSFVAALSATTCAASAAGTAESAPARGGGTTPTQGGFRIDTGRMLRDLRTLAADSFAGRQVGTVGGAMARRYVGRAFAAAGLRPVSDSFAMPFMVPRGRDTAAAPVEGANIVGMVRGTGSPGRVIVLSAHFDHVGIRRPVNGDSIYNGADDNASGTAALLELARWFVAHPPENSIIFAAFDAEESGLRGAREFVAAPPVARDSIAMNVNLDMVSRSEKGELYAVGTLDNPPLLPFIQRAQQRARVALLTGHEGPSATGSNNWTGASDHGAFRAQGIPYLYFGVEDHPGYHQPSDEAAAITPGFYARAVETVLDVLLDLDRNLGSIRRAGE